MATTLSSSVLYGITASEVVAGRVVNLLAYRTARALEIDDVCQELRRELRPSYGESLRISVKPY